MNRRVQPPDPLHADLEQTAKRRGSVRRTALVLAAVAVVIYVAFILSGVLGGASS